MDEITAIVGVDPGTTESAWVKYLIAEDRVEQFETLDNDLFVDVLAPRRDGGWGKSNCILVVEQMASYGKPVSTSVFDTVFWSGRFVQAWGGRFVMYPRRRVKKVLLGKDKGGDPQVHTAVLSWFGGKTLAVGSKSDKGELWGMKGHEWQACGLALAYARELRSGVAPPAVAP